MWSRYKLNCVGKYLTWKKRSWNIENNPIAIFTLSPLGNINFTLLPLGNIVQIIAHKAVMKNYCSVLFISFFHCKDQGVLFSPKDLWEPFGGLGGFRGTVNKIT